MDNRSNPFWGQIKKPSSSARIKGPCGDTMEFFIKVIGNKLSKVRCCTSGCGASKACALETARLAQNKTLAQALLISPGKVIRKLHRIPDDHLHCAILSVTTLHRAIVFYLMTGKKKFRLRA